jgi:Na+-driven multidrug efflux pump
MARRAAVRCMLLAMGIMGTGGVVLIALGGPITRALSDQPAHLQLVPDLLRISGFIQVPFAMAIVMRSSMQGAGDVKAVMKLTWISQWGLRLPLAYAISGVDIPLPEWLLGGVVIENPFPFDLGLPGLWIGLCVEIAIRSCLYGWRFRSGQWLKARV